MTMNPEATAQALMHAIQRGDFEKVKTYLTDNFQLKCGGHRVGHQRHA
jgi:hypothetical protein